MLFCSIFKPDVAGKIEDDGAYGYVNGLDEDRTLASIGKIKGKNRFCSRYAFASWLLRTRSTDALDSLESRCAAVAGFAFQLALHSPSCERFDDCLTDFGA